ncbi:MAG: UDP-3-O-(3-hydroxymyristoyl)glucosamine N-acyltransferase [Phycisphaerae bacterium]
MKPTRYTTQQIADAIGARCEGPGEVEISGPAAIDAAGPGQITFAADSRRAAGLAASKASAAIVADAPESAPMVLLRVDDVEAAWSNLLGLFAPELAEPAEGIDPTARVDASAKIDPAAAIGQNVVIGPGAVVAAGAVIGPNCVLEQDAIIGAATRLHAGVVVRHRCTIGAGCTIGPNCVIGHEGFGYFFRDGAHQLVPHVGNVVIEDSVELGACVCVDRAKFGSTRVGAGTKVDNLVQIAHNVQIGAGCLLVGQCGIAGSARLGDYVIIGGSAGVRDHVQLGDQARLAAYSAAAGDIPAGQTFAGTPAAEAKEAFRQVMALAKLPDLLKQVKKLESRVKALESPEDD